MFRISANMHKFYSAKPIRNTKRSISNIIDLEGSYSAFKPEDRHFSPFYGVMHVKTYSLQRHYDAIQKKNVEQKNNQKNNQENDIDTKNERKSTATERLIESLFNKLGEEFRATNKKTLPAYSLSPGLLAQLIYYLGENKIKDDAVQEKICSQWKAIHRALVNSKLSTVKLQALMDDIILSKSECIQGMYPVNYTETVLLSFLYLKSKSRKDNLEYMATLKSLGMNINYLNKTTNDSVALLQHGHDTLQKITSGNLAKGNPHLEENYESLMIYLLSGLTRVSMSSFSYHDKPPVNNCVEMVFHNICNIILYNKEKNQFDFSMLPVTLNPHPMLQYFYEMQDYNVHTVNSPEIGNAFFYFLSDNPDFIYVKADHELETTPKNFLPIMNFLFGTNANSFEELSKVFSNEKRQLTFEMNYDEIHIGLNDLELKNEYQTIITFTPNHADISTNFFQSDDLIFTSKFLNLALEEFKNNSLLLQAMFVIQNIESSINESDLYRISMNKLSQSNCLDVIYYLMISPFNTTKKMLLLSTMFPKFENNPHWETLINYFITDNDCQNSLAWFAVNQNNLALVEGLMKRGLDINKKITVWGHENTYLIDHARCPKMLALLLQAGAKPSTTKKIISIESEGYDIIPTLHSIQSNASYNPSFFSSASPQARSNDYLRGESREDESRINGSKEDESAEKESLQISSGMRNTRE
jgi:hypothetical protein